MHNKRTSTGTPVHPSSPPKKPVSSESIRELATLLPHGDADEIGEFLGTLDIPEFEPLPAADFEAIAPSTGPAVSRAPGPIETKSKHTTIRLPAAVVNAFRNKASELGIGYQTLITRELRAAATRWQPTS